MVSLQPGIARAYGAPMLRSLEKIDTIVIHHAADARKSTTIETIDRWHMDRGFRRATKELEAFQPALRYVGYQRVIHVSGVVVDGRHWTEVGAHAEGWNARSFGICVVGNGKFSLDQWTALRSEVLRIRRELGKALRVVGHRDVAVEGHTVCPGFDVRAWYADGMDPVEGHIR